MQYRRVRLWTLALAITGVIAPAIGAVGYSQVKSVQPAPSLAYSAWKSSAPAGAPKGAALFAFGDFGVLDLDTLKTSAMPWRILSAALALNEAGGDPDRVEPGDVEKAMKRFGFLFPQRIAGHDELKPFRGAPLGLSMGRIERAFPPIRITAVNLGCAACHTGPAYSADGTPDPDVAALATPNTSLDLEAFATAAYRTIKSALSSEEKLLAAIDRLGPQMTARERLTLRWLVLPEREAVSPHLLRALTGRSRSRTARRA